jgi:hypothetical protein
MVQQKFSAHFFLMLHSPLQFHAARSQVVSVVWNVKMVTSLQAVMKYAIVLLMEPGRAATCSALVL